MMAAASKGSWIPNTGLPVVGGGVASSGSSSGSKVVAGRDVAALPSMWQREKELQGGLFVPPVNLRKHKKLAKKDIKETTGSKWFDMPAATVTPEMKRELQLVKLRGVLDPKRHYKANDSKAIPKFFQVGTVVSGPADFFSGRLTKKEQKMSFADELLTDASLKSFRKRKYQQIMDEKSSGGKKFWKMKKNRQKPSWAKT